MSSPSSDSPGKAPAKPSPRLIAELISSNRGLGYLVQTGATNFDTTSVFAAILAATLVVLGTNWLMNLLEALLLKWRPPFQSMIEMGT